MEPAAEDQYIRFRKIQGRSLFVGDGLASEIFSKSLSVAFRESCLRAIDDGNASISLCHFASSFLYAGR